MMEQRRSTTPREAGGLEKSIGELSSELYRQVSTMIDRQVALARHEGAATMRSAGLGAGTLLAGGAMAQVGLHYLLLAATYKLSERMPRWAAAGVVGLAFAGLGGIVGAAGVRQMRNATQRLPELRQRLREEVGRTRDEAREPRWELRG